MNADADAVADADAGGDYNSSNILRIVELKMLCHRIYTTLNSSAGTVLFVSIQLKIDIMHISQTYLILFIRLVVKSIVCPIKDQSRNISMHLSLVNLLVKVIFQTA
jgi:hypothetical protein